MHRTAFVAVFAVLSLLPTAGCQRDAADVPKPLLTMGTFSKAYGNLPYYIARHHKWFEADPVLSAFQVRYTEYNDRAAISDAFSTDALQVLFSGDAPALLCRAQGNDIRAIAISGNAEQEIVVHLASPIKSLLDLRGRPVVVQQATSSHYALLKLLRDNGLTTNDVRLRYMTAPEARVAFEVNQIDAWAVWAPFVEEQQVGGHRVVSGSNALINSVVSISNDFLTRNDVAARAIRDVIHRAKEWMVLNPDEAQRIASEQLGLKPAVVARAWPKFNWGATLNDAIITDLQNKIAFLASQDQTRRSQSFDVRREYVDSRFERR